MAASELLEIVTACEKMLAKQDCLIADFNEEGRDTSDAICLRMQITGLLRIQDAIRAFEFRRFN
jgi:hypothetical protein